MNILIQYSYGFGAIWPIEETNYPFDGNYPTIVAVWKIRIKSKNND